MQSRMFGSLQRALERTLGLRFVKAKSLERLIAERIELQNEISMLTSDLGSHQGRLSTLETAHAMLQDQHAALESEHAKLQGKFDQFVSLESGLTEYSLLRDRHAALEAEHDKLRNERDHLIVSERALAARVDWLNASYHQFASQQQRLLGDLVASGARAQAVLSRSRDGLGPERKIVIVVMTAVSQITQLTALANSKRLRDEYDLVVVAFVDASRADLRELCERTQITLLSHDLKPVVGTVVVVNELDEWRPDYAPLLAKSGYTETEQARMRDVIDLGSEVKYQVSLSRSARNLLRHVDASLVVVFEDHPEYVTGNWIEMARELSIPAVVVPFTIADELEPAEAYYSNAAYWADSGIHNRLVKALAPQWLYLHRDRWLLRGRGVSALAVELLGLAPPIPWILNSSRADAIAVESEAMRKHYLSHGLPAEQLVMTGSVTDDLLQDAAFRSSELKKELGLEHGRPVLLCSFPPNQLTAARPDCEFADFFSIVDFWLGELKKLSWHVLVKPHPAMTAADLDYLKRSQLQIVSGHETTSLLQICDVYNTSVSSTIRWALACGKPVLNYDVYRYHYRDFVSEPAVLTVFDSQKFSEALQDLAQNGPALARYKEHATAAASQWGMLDGKSMERIVALFNQLSTKKLPSVN